MQRIVEEEGRLGSLRVGTHEDGGLADMTAREERMSSNDKTQKLKRKVYEKELRKLQEELCYPQD